VIDAIPLLADASPGRIVACRGAVTVTVESFLADVRRTAARLPAGGYVMNLCGDRYRFAVALGAALTRGVVSLLPPNVAPQPLKRLAAAYGGAWALTDPGVDFEVEGMAVQLGSGADRVGAASPAFDPSQVAVVAFTSGSTGEPQPQPKTWGSLTDGALAEADALGLRGVPQAGIVGTVPAQHMYGLESSVVLALRNGLALHAARPLYPADVREALLQLAGTRVLVTTPVHLRALLAADVQLPPLGLILCATAPLTPGLAQQAEARYGAPLREIYGFTEAGMVATRRTASETMWQTLPGVRVREEAGVALFCGGHVLREVAAGDLVEVLDPHSFILQGRTADLVNVAGKRTSLAHLEAALTAIDGVEDAAFYLPHEREDGAVTRPVAFAVAPGHSRASLLAALRERIDPVFLPRPLHLVPALPRNATGKLSREALAALAARCALESQHRVAVLVVPDDPVAQGHFPGNPVVPGALILDAVLRDAEQRLGLPPSAWDVRSAKFLSALRPGEALRIDFTASGDGDLKFACRAGERPVASGVLQRTAPPA
jgi:acyl-CoA synthetase (AMP-forming)/AMP-acid ligase II